MHVTPLRASDLQPYRALMLHAYTAAADAFTTTAQERAAEPDGWRLQRMADPSGLSIAFGAFDAGTLVGTVSVAFSKKPKTRHKAHVTGMFVHASARGRGAGRLLLQAALQAAAQRTGVLVVTLTVTEGNTPAISLYQSCGFTAFGTEPMAIATPGGFRGKVHMWAQLDGLPPAAPVPQRAAPAHGPMATGGSGLQPAR